MPVHVAYYTRLTVKRKNRIQQTITFSNQGDVQLRINRAKVKIQEILALQPKDAFITKTTMREHSNPGNKFPG